MTYCLVLNHNQLAVVLGTLKHSPQPQDAIPVYCQIVRQLDLEDALQVYVGERGPERSSEAER